MKVYKIYVKALEPLVITDGTSEGMSHCSLNYIPGNKILGAMVEKWKKHANLNKGVLPDDIPEFNELFLSKEVEWGHAFPLIKEKRTVPIPLSYRVIKNEKKLPVIKTVSKSENNSSEIKCGVRDYIADHTSITVKVKKLGDGFMSPDSKCQPDLKQVWNMHVAIADNRTCSEGKLFGYSAIAAGTTFESEIIVKKDALQKSLNDLLTVGSKFKVGSSRSAGYGLLQIEKVEITDYTSQEAVYKQDDNSAILFLESAFIPKHDWNTPLDALKAELRKITGDDTIEFSKENSFCNYNSISSFNSKWRLPRRTRTAITQGSVIKFTYSKDIRIDSSLGGYVNEGYGRVLINPPFLGKLEPEIKAEFQVIQKNKAISLSNISALKVVKIRAINRIAQEQAIKLLKTDMFDKFVSSCAKSGITSSQIGNIRSLLYINADKTKFTNFFNNISDKDTKQAQIWKKNVKSPFEFSTTESLEAIMKKLFSEKVFISEFSSAPELYGKELFAEDLEMFNREFHRQSLICFIKDLSVKVRNPSNSSN